MARLNILTFKSRIKVKLFIKKILDFDSLLGKYVEYKEELKIILIEL